MTESPADETAGGAGTVAAAPPPELALETGEVRDVVDLEAEQQSTCAVRSDGRVLCWGRNADGSLYESVGAFGLPVAVGSVLRPTFVPDVDDAVEIEIAGYESACVRTRSGGVRCWGMEAPEWTGVRQLVANGGTLCALVEGGRVRCTGESRMEATPDAAMVEIGTGPSRACARSEDGAVWCWGLDVYGMASGGAGGNAWIAPRRIRLPSRATQLAVGDSIACALLSDRRVACWGELHEGVDVVEELRGATSIAVGDRDACATLADAVVCTDGYRQQRMPLAADRVVAGASHTCALAEGRVQCWGRPSSGEIADGGYAGSATPIEVARDVRELLLDASTRSWMRRADGALFTPGSNGGQSWIAEWPRYDVGTRCVWRDGGEARCLRSEYSEPEEATFHDVRAIAGGSELACVLDTSSTLRCTRMVVGTPRTDARFLPPDPVEHVVDFCAHRNRLVCAATEDGRVRCAKGLRQPDDAPRPTPGVDALRDVVEVACGRERLCARTRQGDALCLPYDAAADEIVSVGEPGLRSIAAGGGHFCGLVADGGVACWGANAMGQLGDGTLISRHRAMPVAGIDDAVEVDCGTDHTCVRSEDGVVRCFGRSEDQSGIPWPDERTEPVIVP